jgi:hypothetical protein
MHFSFILSSRPSPPPHCLNARLATRMYVQTLS